MAVRLQGIGTVGPIRRGTRRALPRAPEWVLDAEGIVSSLDIDFVNDRGWVGAEVSIASLLTCTRASTGYYTKADGTLQSFSSNVLRYGDNGLLVEEARTNTSQRSNDLGAAWWTREGITVGTGVADPAGGANAVTWTNTTDNSNHRTYILNQTVTDVAWTFSVYAKAGTAAFIQISAFNGTDTYYANFNLGSGAVGNKHASATASIEALANGWYRCILTRTMAAVASANWQVNILEADTASENPTYVGTEKTISLFGFQSEAGSFPSSYIPTTSSSATRAADVVTLTSFTPISQTTGTIYVQHQLPQILQFAMGVSIDNAAHSEVHWLLADNTSGRVQYSVYDGDVNQVDINNGNKAAFAANSTVKGVAAYAQNDFASTFNGGAIETDTSGTLPTTTTFRIGSTVSSNYINGYIHRVAYWNSRLSNSALPALTA